MSIITEIHKKQMSVIPKECCHDIPYRGYWGDDGCFHIKDAFSVLSVAQFTSFNVYNTSLHKVLSLINVMCKMHEQR